MTVNQSDYLAHYGVLGMKWGVRKDVNKAYSRSIKKLRKIDSAHQKAAARKAQVEAKNYEYKAAKLGNRSAKLSNKSSALAAKSTKLSSKSAKYAAKSDKAYNKAMSRGSTKARGKAIAKSQKYADKSDALQRKSEKVAAKSQKLASKSRTLDSKSKQLAYTVANVNYKEQKLQQKGQKWVERMNKEFSGKTLSSVSQADLEYGKKRAIEIANSFTGTTYHKKTVGEKAWEAAMRTSIKYGKPDKDVKHSAMADELYLGVMQASEALAHYGVKGMKWGVRKEEDAPKSTSKASVGTYGKYSSTNMSSAEIEKAIKNKRAKDEAAKKEKTGLAKWIADGLSSTTTTSSELVSQSINGVVVEEGESFEEAIEKAKIDPDDDESTIAAKIKKAFGKKFTDAQLKAFSKQIANATKSYRSMLKKQTKQPTMSVGKSRRQTNNAAIAKDMKKKRQSFGKG